jgi:hypothetical protein
VEELEQHGPVPGLEPAALGWAQAVVGELEVGEGIEGSTHLVEPSLEPGGQRAQGRGAAPRGPHDGHGRRQQRAPLGRALGHAVGAEQRQGLGSGEPVLVDGLDERGLLLDRPRTQRVGQGHAEAPGVEPRLQRRRELLGQREPLHDPATFAPAGLGDGGGPEVLLVPQRPHHARLVHRRERARRPVGREQGGLLLHRRAHRLHEHRHALRAELPPAGQPLEPVEHLVGAVRGGRHP